MTVTPTPRERPHKPSISSYNPIAEVRRGRRVSPKRAREIALRIAAEAEARLREERHAEARFLLAFDDDATTIGV